MSKTKHSKMEFGRKLQNILNDKNWSQADLVREVERVTGTKIGRDAVSTYINGRSFPTQASLGRLSQALGVSPVALAATSDVLETGSEKLTFEMRSLGSGQAFVRLEGSMSFAMATEISQLLLKIDSVS